jgi:hypothetical protein
MTWPRLEPTPPLCEAWRTLQLEAGSSMLLRNHWTTMCYVRESCTVPAVRCWEAERLTNTLPGSNERPWFVRHWRRGGGGDEWNSGSWQVYCSAMILHRETERCSVGFISTSRRSCRLVTEFRNFLRAIYGRVPVTAELFHNFWTDTSRADVVPYSSPSPGRIITVVWKYSLVHKVSRLI